MTGPPASNSSDGPHAASTPPDVSVLIATHNRAEILRETLVHLTGIDTAGLSVEYVVIDNNSDDGTREVVESYADRLSVRYLFEPKPGKNCALNHALDRALLGDIVVFIDDDISPCEGWLGEIRSAVGRHPTATVFGGKIEIQWPTERVPLWAASPEIQTFAFGAHERPGGEGPYWPEPREGPSRDAVLPKLRRRLASLFAGSSRRRVWPQHPFGGNLWVRRSVFDDGLRFDESVGPRPKNRIMGSETTFLSTLRRLGHEAVYVPSSVVGHRVELEMISESAVRRRAYRQGRGAAHWRGPVHGRLFTRARGLWYVAAIGSAALAAVIAALSMLSWSPTARVERCVRAIKHFGYATESLRCAWRGQPGSVVYGGQGAQGE